MQPKKIIYKENDVAIFDLERFKESLAKYGTFSEELLAKRLNDFSHYDPLHVSCLTEIAISVLDKDEDAEKFMIEHRNSEIPFERLRRITGYLVGTLDRWNDAKKAEESQRVKHNVDGVYTIEEKAQREFEKQKQEKAYGTV